MLKYTVEQPLQLPQKAFDAAGVARVKLAGGSYGGCWVYGAWTTNEGLTKNEALVGKMRTDRAPGQSDQANQSALDWATKAFTAAGFRVDVIDQASDQYMASVILAVAQPSAPPTAPEPQTARAHLEYMKDTLLRRAGFLDEQGS